MIARLLLAVLCAAASAAPAAPRVELRLSKRAERHVREGHFADGRRSRGKSLFFPKTDLLGLLKAAEDSPPRRQENGRDKRVTDAGRAIGTDGRTRKPVSSYVVIAEPDGDVVTMYPGK